VLRVARELRRKLCNLGLEATWHHSAHLRLHGTAQQTIHLWVYHHLYLCAR
jgi:hypothetical protein